MASLTGVTNLFKESVDDCSRNSSPNLSDQRDLYPESGPVLSSSNGVANNQTPIKNYGPVNNSDRSSKRKVFRFETDWLISSVAWCNESGESLKIALSSYIEDYQNFVQLVTLPRDDNDQEIQNLTVFEHPYPATKVLWCPQSDRSSRLLATTADYLRIWHLEERDLQNRTQSSKSSTKAANSFHSSTDSSYAEFEVKLACLLNSNQGSKLCAPLTSFDWNEVDPSLIVTASVDTTCAIWNIETSGQIIGTTCDLSSPRVSGNLKTQLVAHDHQVYDVSFSRLGSGKDIFVSSSGDGSVRLFDLRRLSTSKVLYEIDASGIDNLKRALVRVACSKQDPNLVSTFAADSNEVLLIDIRQPGRLMNRLTNHKHNINGMSWAPHLSNHLCTASDDRQALIWDLSKLPDNIGEPVLGYHADEKINAVNWSSSQPDWIAIGFRNCLELLRV